jgi:OFA family oxalate/formate antiporter-like MFS transporter
MTAATFSRSPAFSVFSSLVGDYYGTAFSSENYAVLYPANPWGGVATVASELVVRPGWSRRSSSGRR